MLSSLLVGALAVSPKAWLASYISQALADWCEEVDPCAIETDLFHHSGICLKHIQLRKGLGHIECIQFQWTWSSSGCSLSDVSLHISGVRLIVLSSNTHTTTRTTNTTNTTDEDEPSNRAGKGSNSTAGTANSTWKEKVFQQIIDHLTLIVTDVCISLEVPSDSNDDATNTTSMIKVWLDQMNLKTLGIQGSQPAREGATSSSSSSKVLDQWLEVVGLHANVVSRLHPNNDDDTRQAAQQRQQRQSYKLLDPWNGMAQVQRVAGRRFVDGIVTGLLVVSGVHSGDGTTNSSSMLSPIRLRVGPKQLQTALALSKVWSRFRCTMEECACEGDGDGGGASARVAETPTKENNNNMERQDDTYDASQVRLNFPAIELVLENEAVLSCRDCVLRYHLDGSVCAICCHGDVQINDSVVMQYSYPLEFDLLGCHVRPLDRPVSYWNGIDTPHNEAVDQDLVAAAENQDTGPDSLSMPSSIELEMDSTQFQTMLDGIQNSVHILLTTDNHSHSTEADDSIVVTPSWFVNAGELLSLNWKGTNKDCCIQLVISTFKATSYPGGWSVSWDNVEVNTSENLQLSIPSGILDENNNLILKGSVSGDLHLGCWPTNCGKELLTLWNKISQTFLLGEDSARAAENESKKALLPFALSIPLVRFVVRDGLTAQPGHVVLEEVQSRSSDGSIVCAGVSVSGIMCELASFQLSSIYASVSKAQVRLIQGSRIIEIHGSIGCRLETPTGVQTDIVVDSPCMDFDGLLGINKSNNFGDGLPFRLRWKSLSLLHQTSLGKLHAMVPSGTLSEDGLSLSIPGEAAIQVSSLHMVESCRSFCNEIAVALSTSDPPPARAKESGIPFRVSLSSCGIKVNDDGSQMSVLGINAYGMACSCDSIKVEGFFFPDSLLCLRSLSLLLLADDDKYGFQSSFSVTAVSVSNLFRLSSPAENVTLTYQQGNAVSIDMEFLAVDVLQSSFFGGNNGSGTDEMAGHIPVELSVDLHISVRSAMLQLVHTMQYTECNVPHSSSITMEQMMFSYSGSSAFKYCMFGCELLCLGRNSQSSIQTELEGLETKAHFNPKVTSAVLLWVSNVGELCSLTLSVRRVRRLSVPGGSLARPLDGITATLEGHVVVTQIPFIEWQMDASVPKDPPAEASNLLPLPVQAHMAGCVVFTTHADGKLTKLASVGTTSVMLEPLSDSPAIRFHIINASEFIYLDKLRAPKFAASAVVSLDRLDVLHKATLDLKETLEIMVDLSWELWNSSPDEGSHSSTHRLPKIHISEFEVMLSFVGEVVRMRNARLKLGPFNGCVDKDFSSVASHYVEQIKKRLPHLVLKTDVLGVNVGDQASSFVTTAALSSTIGGSVAGVVCYDAIGSAITMGKESRRADQSDQYQFGDLSRGVVASVQEAARSGARMRGDDQYQFGDVTAAATSSTVQYAANNRVRLSSALGSGMGMAAGLAVAGPVGLVGGAVLGAKAAGGVVAKLTGDPKEEEERYSSRLQVQRQESQEQRQEQERNGTRNEYQVGDVTRGILARGKERRGGSTNSKYKFGDFTRGLFGSS